MALRYTRRGRSERQDLQVGFHYSLTRTIRVLSHCGVCKIERVSIDLILFGDR